ncbi:hypothetical protein ABN763_01340 [Spongiivirga sp. MCCC 1A20706]|uniref:hypothetical protein n=1 Tax=Spongiivirga sp. MCCC 1A20706 TaxID=3160963 RepID=UPI003977D060
MSTSKKIISIVLGTLILFIWSMVSWMALPFHENTITQIPEGTVDLQKMQNDMPEDGVYHYPGMPVDDSPETMAAMEEKLNTGPRIALMVYKSGATKLMDPMQFAIGLVINLLVVISLFYIVSKLADKSTKSILGVLIVVGLIIGLASDFAMLNWWMFPMDFTITNVVDYLVSFTLVGLLFGSYTFKMAKNK